MKQLNKRKKKNQKMNVDDIELTEQEEKDLLKEEIEEEKQKEKKRKKDNKKEESNNDEEEEEEEKELNFENIIIQLLEKIYPFLLSFSDSVLFVFEFLFVNTIVQTLLSMTSFHHFRKKSSIHECNSCSIINDFNINNNNSSDSGSIGNSSNSGSIGNSNNNEFNSLLKLNWNECFNCVLSKDFKLILLDIFYVIGWSFLISFYFIWRYDVHVKKLFKFKLSGKAIFVIFISLFGLGLMIWFQYQNNEWIYSLSNFKSIQRENTNDPFGLFSTNTTTTSSGSSSSSNDESIINNEFDDDEEDNNDLYLVNENNEIPNLNPDEWFEKEKLKYSGNSNNNNNNEGKDGTNREKSLNDKNESLIDYLKLLQLTIGAPILEEIILRCVLFYLFKKRTSSVISSIVLTNILFSLLHVFSIEWEASDFYTLIQVISAFIVGMFYGTRFYLSGNLIENITLHILNNLTAIFIPINLTFNDLYPKYMIPCKFLF
jgi:membrane protease YdiL (CAAX protease family)